MRHLLSEGSDRLACALARAKRAPSQARALATNWAGRIAATQGNFARAKPLLEESVEVSRAIGDGSLLSLALRHLAIVEQALGHDDVADVHLMAALAEAERGRDARETGWNLTMLGHRATQAGDLFAGRQQLNRALLLLQQSGDHSGVAYAQSCLSRLEAEEGNLARARTLVDSAAMTAEDLELRRTCVNTMGDAVEAILALQAGDVPAARRHARDALHIAREHGEHETCLAALLAHAGLLAKNGEPTDAVRLYAVVAAQSAAPRVIAQVLGRNQYESALTELRMRLGSAAFDEAWLAGRNSTLEQAIDDALRASTDVAPVGLGRT
jgi:tetratricopeptide (TPR) repeat protein